MYLAAPRIVAKRFPSGGRIGLRAALVAITLFFGAVAMLAPSALADSARWSPAFSADPDGGGFTAIACPSAEICIAVDQAGNAFNYDGNPTASEEEAIPFAANWSKSEPIDPHVSLISLTCPTDYFCAALDRDGRVVTRTMGLWGPPEAVGANFQLDALSCGSPTSCIAVGNEYVGVVPAGLWEGKAIEFNGASWGSPKRVDSYGEWGGHLSSLSCPSTSFCVAVGGVGLADYEELATFDGSNWSANHGQPGPGLYSVSCASSVFCASVGLEAVRLFDGASWTSAEIAGIAELESVSCGSESFCGAVGNNESRFFNGTSWSSAIPITSGGEQEHVQIACTANGTCLAIDDRGDAYIHMGGAPRDEASGHPAEPIPPSPEQVAPAVYAWPPSPGSGPPAKHRHPLQCRKGFKRKSVRGRIRCVRVSTKHAKSAK